MSHVKWAIIVIVVLAVLIGAYYWYPSATVNQVPDEGAVVSESAEDAALVEEAATVDVNDLGTELNAIDAELK